MFDAIYTSPLIRAYKTARAICERQKLQPPLYTREGLREINAGELEGLTIRQIEELYPAEYHNWRYDIAWFQSPRGESFAALYARVKAEFHAVAEDALSRGYGRICVVAHGAVLYSFFNYADGYAADEASNRNFWAENTSVSRVQYDESEFKVIYFNDISHFDDETKPYVMFMTDSSKELV